MPDPSLSAAIKEAYASAPTDTVILHTLELRHPDFVAPIRDVNDHANLTATLEATATNKYVRTSAQKAKLVRAMAEIEALLGA